MRRPIGLICAILCVLGLTTATAQAAPHRSPGQVHHLRAVSHSSTSVSLSWTRPAAKAFRRTVVRYAVGTRAPRTARSGHSAARFGRTRHSLTLGRLRSGQSYAFAVFALDSAGHAGPRVTTTVAVAPAPVTDVRSFALPAATQLTWVDPRTRSFARVVVRVAKGAAAPSTPTRGRQVRVPSARATTASVSGLARNTTYAVSVWAFDRKGGYSTPSITRFTTSAGADPNGTLTGTVTDTAGNGLSGVEIDAAGDNRSSTPTVFTGPEGHFTLSVPADDYTLFVGGGTITGGNSDTTGYVATFGEAVVRSGATTTLTAIELDSGAAVTGTIVDEHGKPVPDAYPYAVAVSRFVQPDTEDFVSYSSGGTFGAQRSGPDGTFTLLGVPTDGAVRICAEPSDPGHSSACSERTVVLAAGDSKPVPAVTLPAQSGGTVEGTVRSSSGSAVANAWVYLQGTTDDPDLYLSAPTDSNGHYEVDAVPPGSYQACAQTGTASSAHPTGYADGCSTKSAVVTEGRPTTLNVTLAVGAALTGTVTGPTGRPVARADVSVRGKDFGAGARTNSHGQYTVTGLSPGPVEVCIGTGSDTGSGIATGVQPGCWHGGTKLTVTAGRVRSGIDVRLATGAAISGTLLAADGTPAAYAFVGADSSDGDDEGNDGSFNNGGSAQTDAAGHYTIRGLAAGSYDVCFEGLTAAGSDVSACSPSTVTVKVGHTVNGVNGRLPKVSAIQVSVKDGDGQAVAGVDAVAFSSCPHECDPQPLFNADAGVAVDASQPTDATGAALLDGISTGSYAVCLYAFNATTSTGGSPTGYADSCSGTTFSVHVSSGSTTDVALVLSPGGAVSGTVSDADGNPVAGVQALVSDSAGTDYNYGEDDGFGDFVDEGEPSSSPQGYGYSAADGTYTVIGVQPGARTVCFDPTQATGGASPAGYRYQCLGTAPGVTTGTTQVTVTAGDTTSGTNVALTAAAGVSGTVRHGTTGVVGAQVIVFNGTNVHDVVGSGTTGVDGSYTVGGLVPGSVTVCFYAQGLHGQCYKNVPWDGESNPPLGDATAVAVAAGTLHPGVGATLT